MRDKLLSEHDRDRNHVSLRLNEEGCGCYRGYMQIYVPRDVNAATVLMAPPENSRERDRATGFRYVTSHRTRHSLFGLRMTNVPNVTILRTTAICRDYARVYQIQKSPIIHSNDEYHRFDEDINRTYAHQLSVNVREHQSRRGT